MTCIDEQLLQKYIDGECTENEKKEVKQHLSDCLECTRKQAEREKLSVEIKLAISSLTIPNVEIPIFEIKKPSSGKNIKLILYSLSAACIILFMLIFNNKKNDSYQPEITIVQNIPCEIDANRPASKQEFVIEVIDDKGGRSELFFE